MNPYSQLGLDPTTLGYVAQAGVNPMANAAPTPNAQPSAYPTYPNAAGVGSQTAGNVNSAPVTSATTKSEVPDTNARGINPYSLIGDANYRQR